jgi:predicted aminopeptidase
MCLLLLGMWGCPRYSVYQQNLEGEAELARATQNRQISIQEAQAKKESAKDLAEAEVIRADGVSRANKIIGESLKGNEAYLRYLWIDKLDQDAGTIIYIPTEAGMPILEANRLKQATPKE